MPQSCIPVFQLQTMLNAENKETFEEITIYFPIFFLGIIFFIP